MSKLYDLPFDQYQRYKLVSTLVDELRAKGESLSILDVGGRTALLRGFLKHDRVTLVDLEPSGEKGLVLGDGSALPFRDRSFDLVCAFDTLEHVPPGQRARFVRECARVARRWVVLAGPYQSDEVEEAEKLLQKFLREKLGVRHRYLEEHRHHGLPERAATEKQLAQLGLRVQSQGHGNLQRWLALISLSMYMDHTPALQAAAVRLQRFYNRGLFDSDDEPPVYRHAVIAAVGEAPLPRPRSAHAEARAPAKELLHFAQELAAFDAHRDGYQAEFARLQVVVRALEADLAGHKASLAEALARRDEARRALHDLAADLEGHRHSLKELRARQLESQAVIATLRADLEGHRQSLQAADAQRTQAQAVIATLRQDLEGHRRSLAELLELRAEAEAVIAGLQQDLDGQRAALHELQQGVARYEGLLGEQRAVIAERERELERHARVQDELRAGLAALEAERSKLFGLREGEQLEYKAVLAQLERELELLRTAREQELSDLATLREHASGLEAHLRQERAAFGAEVQRLERARLEAERAWQAERRAFGSVIAAREAELVRHAEHEGILRAELEQARAVRERELAEQRRLLAEQRSELEVQRALVAAQAGELAERDALLATRALELAQERTEVLRGASDLANARDQLADLRQALERARVEISSAAGALEDKQQQIDLMRVELKNRLRSLRRALGPARPTPGE